MNAEKIAFSPLLLARIEDAGLNASAPTEQRWLDGWLVRFSQAKAKRARCVNAVAMGSGDLTARIERCRCIYAEAGLPAIFRITPFSQPPDLDAHLAALGMARFDETSVMALSGIAHALESSDDHDDGCADSEEVTGISIRSVGIEAFAQRVGNFRASALSLRQAHSDRLRHSPVPVRAFELLLDGHPAACAQFTREDDLVGLYDVHTLAPYRGRGLAGRLCRHLLRQAANEGARHAYLQVEADNHAARSVYRRIGFADAYHYHYRAPAPNVAP